MVRPPIKTVGPHSHAGPGAVSSPRDRRRFMEVFATSVTRPAIAGRSRVLLLGARRDARRLIRIMGAEPWSGLPIVGFVDARHTRSSSLKSRSRHLAIHPQTDPIPVLGGIDRLDELIARARATDIVVAVTGNRPSRMGPELSQLGNADVAVHWVHVDSGTLDFATLAGPRSSGSTEWHVQFPRVSRHTIKRRLEPPQRGSRIPTGAA